jgi:hypothetical protein
MPGVDAGLSILPYDREKAVAYAHRWAFSRNPAYYDFSALGGDCTNFASQCVYAGTGIMNYKPVYGWYYVNAGNRTPSWTGEEYFYNFMVNNTGVGTFMRVAELRNILPGDIYRSNLTGRITSILPSWYRWGRCRPLPTYSSPR